LGSAVAERAPQIASEIYAGPLREQRHPRIAHVKIGAVGGGARREERDCRDKPRG
jgi:hypothetical protein